MPGPASGLRLGCSSRHCWCVSTPGHSIKIDPVRPGYTAVSRAKYPKSQQPGGFAQGAKLTEPAACMVATITAASLRALIKSRTRAICSRSLRA